MSLVLRLRLILYCGSATDYRITALPDYLVLCLISIVFLSLQSGYLCSVFIWFGCAVSATDVMDVLYFLFHSFLPFQSFVLAGHYLLVWLPDYFPVAFLLQQSLLSCCYGCTRFTSYFIGFDVTALHCILVAVLVAVHRAQTSRPNRSYWSYWL